MSKDHKEDVSFGQKLKNKFSEYKGEFSKIIWPSKKEVAKSSVTVIITCIIFGVVIFILDYAFNQGMGMLTKLIG